MAPFMDRDKVIFLEVVEVHFHKNDLYWTRFPSIIRRTRLQTSSQYCRTKRCGVCISCLSGTRKVSFALLHSRYQFCLDCCRSLNRPLR